MSVEMNKTVKLGDKEFLFRLPTAKDMIQIDMDALQMRQGTQGLELGYVYTQNIATLNNTLVSPKEFDFDSLLFFELEEVADEVVGWINSFRNRVGNKQTATDGASQG